MLYSLLKDINFPTSWDGDIVVVCVSHSCCVGRPHKLFHYVQTVPLSVSIILTGCDGDSLVTLGGDQKDQLVSCYNLRSVCLSVQPLVTPKSKTVFEWSYKSKPAGPESDSVIDFKLDSK